MTKPTLYRELKTDRIVATLELLCQRIRERFPDAGLARVAQEVLDFAGETEARIQRLRRPLWLIRAITIAVIVFAITVIVFVVRSIHVTIRVDDFTNLVQGLEAAVNTLILTVIAFVSLWTIEGRMKRRDSLRALHELRSLAHVIDMHQLTKDPEFVLSASAESTPSSPQRRLTRFQLGRYLTYCSELLAHVGKLAALHIQYLRDPVVLEAVNDVEALADGLARKIWQKLTMLETMQADQVPKEVPTGEP